MNKIFEGIGVLAVGAAVFAGILVLASLMFSAATYVLPIIAGVFVLIIAVQLVIVFAPIAIAYIKMAFIFLHLALVVLYNIALNVTPMIIIYVVWDNYGDAFDAWFNASWFNNNGMHNYIDILIIMVPILLLTWYVLPRIINLLTITLPYSDDEDKIEDTKNKDIKRQVKYRSSPTY